jgi:hypothetical protein
MVLASTDGGVNDIRFILPNSGLLSDAENSSVLSTYYIDSVEWSLEFSPALATQDIPPLQINPISSTLPISPYPIVNVYPWTLVNGEFYLPNSERVTERVSYVGNGVRIDTIDDELNFVIRSIA